MIRKTVPTVLLLAATSCFAAPVTHHAHVRSTHAILRHTASSRSHRATAAHHEAAAGMAPERATEIQTALIKAGYLSGQPTGVWDAQSAAAMQKLQSDNGWQTKITPDSRALIKLGLGPRQDTAAIDSTSTSSLN